nr:copia protein [Tanacetum cinerariifolium]
MKEENHTPAKSESNTDEDDVWYFDNGASNHMTCNYTYFSKLNENITGRVRFKDGSHVSIKGKGFILFQDKRQYLVTILVSEVNLHNSSVTVHETNPESKEYNSRSDNMPNPLVQLETIRLLTALAARKGWKIHHLDVKTAFINGNQKKLDSTLKELGTSLDCINKFKRRMASQFEMSNLGKLTYYLGTISFGIKYKRGNDIILVGYSSHNVDIDDGQSTTGHVFYLGTSLITWCLQKETTMVLSSCEAEFMAATAAVCQAIWLREVLAKVIENEQVII